MSTTSKKICLDAPNVGVSEKRFLAKAVDSGYVSTIGPFVPEFERKMARYLGAKYAVSTQSGTAALHMALYELGIGEGDEVIVPALTFAATVNPVTYVRARPVFADVDPVTFNIDPEDVRAKITKRTKAIIPVHLYGNPCDMGSLMSIARKHGLYVIEDATESIGATFGKRHMGTFGDLGCLSFNGNKTITTGGGGMVIGRNGRKIEHIKFLVNQARDSADGYYHSEIGFNYRMTNIEAALGLAQLSRLRGLLERKRRIHAIYRDALSGVKGIRFQKEHEGGRSSWWFTTIIWENDIGSSVVNIGQRLKDRGIPTRRFFMPITEFEPYREHKGADLRASYKLYERGLCLPSSTLNAECDIVEICKTIKAVIG